MRTDIVVGGQFGSEAKGHVAGILAESAPAEEHTTCIRVGGPNAGHSVADATGRVWAFRTVPVAAVVSGMSLYIGPGSEVEVPVLLDEIIRCERAGFPVTKRMYVDPQVTILTEDHKAQERDMQERIGSTAKGIGAARADRLWRTAYLAQDIPSVFEREGINVGCPPELAREDAIIEGTQGYGLGLHAGWYPYCTAGDCRNVDFLAQSGLPLVGRETHTWIVYRAHPIRVAGNSGALVNEISWDVLHERSYGYINPEMTTVTKKVRRVADWDDDLAVAALHANGGPGTRVHPVLSFVDYLDPSLAGSVSFDQLRRSEAWPTIEQHEDALGWQFELFTTGPASHIWDMR